MSESIWWPDEAWYERKSLPLGFVTLFFRQLGTLLLSLGEAFLLSLLFNFPTDNASSGGRAAVSDRVAEMLSLPLARPSTSVGRVLSHRNPRHMTIAGISRPTS